MEQGGYQFVIRLSAPPNELFQLVSLMLRFIPTMTTGVLQTFGKYSRMCSPGLTIYIPGIQTIHDVSNRLCENHCNLKVRTADKVFPQLDITIQYRVKPEDSAKAFFEMTDPVSQMISYADNTVRKVASHLTLDELFQSQSAVAEAIISNVGPRMAEGGFTIESAQVRNISPPEEVLKSMNEINASERRKIAAKNDGQALKIKAVLHAEAEAQEKSLRGKGIAEMRENITKGWTESIAKMAEQTNQKPEFILEFLVKVLQQETMETMSKQADTKVIFVDKSVDSSMTSPRDSIIQALEAHNYKAPKV